jgi:inosine-uridine nucleoside N-ribohydrolase
VVWAGDRPDITVGESMKLRTRVYLTALALCVSVATLAAHEVTYKGKVVSNEERTVVVKVVDAETEAESSMTFKFNVDTKVLRGDTLVPLAQANLKKDENISVTVDLDVDEFLAVVVRLDEKP